MHVFGPQAHSRSTPAQGRLKHQNTSFLFAFLTTTIQTMHCGIVEVTNIEDTAGYPCGKDASAKCSDCGTHMCDTHAAHCELCTQTLCATCLAFHIREQHLKKPAAVGERQRRKSA